MMNVRIAGVGACVPPVVVTNERLVKAIPGWAPERIEEKTGIRERRYAWDFDEVTGRTRAPEVIADPGPNVQMAAAALREALDVAGMDAAELDGLMLTGCTLDQTHFSHDALLVHELLGMRSDAFALAHDDGCGGAMFHLAMARELIAGRSRRSIAVVGSNAFSAHLDREVYAGKLRHQGKDLGSFLSFYLFGDGAGCVLLRGDDTPGPSRILASHAVNQRMDLVMYPGGGNLWPQGRARSTDYAFFVDGQLVAKTFVPELERAVHAALARAEVRLEDVSRFYLHQANKRLIEAFLAQTGLPAEKVPTHMERYGNMVTAGTLVLLAEEVREGRVRLGSGELVVMAALGAGAQVAAHVVRL